MPAPRIPNVIALRFLVACAVLGGFPVLLCAYDSTPGSGDASFGSRDSIAVQSAALATTSANTFKSAFNLWPAISIANNQVMLTPTSTNNFMLNGSGGYGIPYRVYADASYTVALTQNGQMDFFDRLSRTDDKSGSFRLFFRTAAGANVPAGVYRDTINVRWDWRICKLSTLICLDYEYGNATTAIRVELVVTKACQIGRAPDVDFGRCALVANFEPVMQSVTLTCTRAQPYRTYFSDGNSYDGAWKRMTQGGAALQYNLYVPGTGTPWDSRNRQGGTGTGQPQSLPYTARVNAAQPEQPAGAYSDSVSIVVEY
ncbi:spore coat protein U-like protein [Paraburkholderia caballeronis]|nr:spore coat protein U-like protein [Paraburkholderia caballeronis]